jgi:spoIIIJ-associated protein
MEWVETTGRTLDEARERALDELGVDEADAEFEVIEDAQTGLFGRVRREARVRARVRPVQPRPKNDRRDRRRKGNGSSRGAAAGGGTEATADDAEATPPPTPAPSGRTRTPKSGDRTPSGGSERRGRRSAPTDGASDTAAPSPHPTTDTRPDAGTPSNRTPGDQMTTPLTLEEQADRMTEFLDGLLGAFGYDGSIERVTIDDETIELAIEGDDLGLLIGPKGQTLASVQELARVASTRDAGFPTDGRVRIDVGGYRQRRREALERFAQKVAADVLDSGRQKVLEPMSPPDRKVVHDTVNTIDGVRTFSEGEDAARRVVIAPE